MCMRRLKSDFSRSKVGLSSEQSLGFLRANSDFATYLLYRIVDTGSQLLATGVRKSFVILCSEHDILRLKYLY